MKKVLTFLFATALLFSSCGDDTDYRALMIGLWTGQVMCSGQDSDDTQLQIIAGVDENAVSLSFDEGEFIIEGTVNENVITVDNFSVEDGDEEIIFDATFTLDEDANTLTMIATLSDGNASQACNATLSK